MDDTRGNRNKKIRSIKRSFDKDKTELENDKNKKIKDDVKSKDRLQKEKNLSNDRRSNKSLNSSKNKGENLKKEVKTIKITYANDNGIPKLVNGIFILVENSIK